MGILDWLFETKTSQQEALDKKIAQELKDFREEQSRRDTFVIRVQNFKKKFEKSDAYKKRKSRNLSEEIEQEYLKAWSKLKKEAKKLMKEQSEHLKWAEANGAAGKLFDYDLIENYLDFPRDNPYQVNIAIRETKAAILKDWPTSKLRQECVDLIDQHFLVLKRSFRDAVIINKYGRIEEDKRLTELRRFLMEFKLLGELEKFSRKRFVTKKYRQKLDREFCLGSGFIQQTDLLKYVKKKIKEQDKSFEKNGFNPTSYPTDGIEFEAWVEVQLSMFGWVANATQASSDQGVDILAEKDGVSIAVQCKRYSKPVGNKAVQEIAAGMQHYMADCGAVIATAKYTRSAKQLAKTNNIYLLSIDDIPNLYAIVSG